MHIAVAAALAFVRIRIGVHKPQIKDGFVPGGVENGQIVVAHAGHLLTVHCHTVFVGLEPGHQLLFGLLFGHAVLLVTQPLVVMVAEHQGKGDLAVVNGFAHNIHRRLGHLRGDPLPPTGNVVTGQGDEVRLRLVNGVIHQVHGGLLGGVGVLNIG